MVTVIVSRRNNGPPGSASARRTHRPLLPHTGPVRVCTAGAHGGSRVKAHKTPAQYIGQKRRRSGMETTTMITSSTSPILQ